jgi:membrane fusion protein, multidrug efflux system
MIYKNRNMQTTTKIFTAAFVLLLASSCSNSNKDATALLNDKKAALEKLKAEKTKANDAIVKMQDELAKLDTNAANSAKIKLVATVPVSVQNFQHFIDLQGQVNADNISYISPRMGPSQVKAVLVRQGQFVKKGQLLLKLDDAIIRQQVVASRQQVEGVKTQLAFAKNIYQRQKNLWDQGIGTEVQLITAKTNVQGLEDQLKASAEQIKVAIEQLNTANVYSDVSGVADEVNIKVGETFMGMTAMGAQIKIVNTSSLKVVTSIPENYLTRVRTGIPAIVSIPDINKTFNSSVSLISQSVDANRGFTVDVKIPFDKNVKPNQSAKVKIMDYNAPNAIVIPINMVQADEAGKYVYVLEKGSNGKAYAKKKNVVIGEVYGSNVEIKAGLSAGEQLITEGFQNLYENQLITTSL